MAFVRGDRRGERGAAFLEAAIITPLFFTLIFGIFEFGLLFRDSLTTTNAGKQGARSASVSGQRPDADYLILRSIEHGLQAMGTDELELIVVFRASGPDDVVPPSCLVSSQLDAGPGTLACNRYTPAHLALDIDDSAGDDVGNFRCSTTAVDRYWCPADRETSISGGVEYVGVYVETSHSYITGLFGGGTTLTETTILRLEPESQ